MSVYIRRFPFDPGTQVLLQIEAVDILDLDPPAAISGIGTGAVLVVGEFENGPFATGGNSFNYPPTQGAVLEVSGATDFVNNFGSLGYTYAGVNGNYPSAVKRSADSAVTPEFWNGNGFVQLSGKKFARLFIARVDTSVGTVQFKRQAFLTGTSGTSYKLSPGQTAVVDVANTTSTATFTAAAASLASSAGTYPSTFAGGETLTLGYDAAANFTVTFQAGDQSQAQVVARINAFAGFAFAAVTGGNVTTFTGLQQGSAGQVRVVAGTALVLTKMGLSAPTTTFGTGNVQNIAAVTFQEIKAIITAAVAGTAVSQDQNGNLRIDMTFVSSNDWISWVGTSTATALGFSATDAAGNVLISSNSGFAIVDSGSAAGYGSIANGNTLTLGNDNSPNFVVTFQTGDTTQANIIARINQYAGYAMASAIDATHIQLIGNLNGGQVRVISGSSGVLANLALSATVVDAVALAAGLIPAGTIVQNASGTQLFATMQDVSVTVAATSGINDSGVGPYTVKVRPAPDDGTGTSATAGTITALQRDIALGSFNVNNLVTLTAALTDSQIDAQYVSAIALTVDTNGTAHDTNIIFSARQSSQVRKALSQNATNASSGGCLGRMACIRPPLGTTRAAALSGSTDPGVGANRDQRTIYCYPGANTFVPIIAQRGLNGGTGFTSTGNVDVGADGFMASILSQLPPEENPGQLTTFMGAVNDLETSPNANGFQIQDYINFRAAGIAALRMDEGTAIFQSGVTSVDPSVFPNLRNIARRRMADFIQDTLAQRAKAFGKKLSTFVRRKAMTNEIRQFMESLLSRGNLASQRIAGFTIDDKSGNTQSSLGQGIYRIIIKVQTLASLDAIVLQTTIGETVQVDEFLPQAA